MSQQIFSRLYNLSILSKILEIFSSPLIKAFINGVDEYQLINDSHIHLQVVLKTLKIIKDDVFKKMELMFLRMLEHYTVSI